MEMLFPRVRGFTNADMQARPLSPSDFAPSDVPVDLQRGIDHEDEARQAYVVTLSGFSRCDVPGICVANRDVDPTGEDSCFGYSPDGLIHFEDGSMDLLEVKCPRAWYSGSKRGMSTVKTEDGGTVAIPRYYLDQVQGGCLLLQRIYGEETFRRIHFVQWVEGEIRGVVIPFDFAYANALLSQMRTMWHTELLPRIVLRDAHLLGADGDPEIPLDDGSELMRDEDGRVLFPMTGLNAICRAE